MTPTGMLTGWIVGLTCVLFAAHAPHEELDVQVRREEPQLPVGQLDAPADHLVETVVQGVVITCHVVLLPYGLPCGSRWP